METFLSMQADREAMEHTSAIIEPLNIVKLPSRTRSNRSVQTHHTRQSSVKTQRTPSQKSHAQISPPLTPRASREMNESRRDTEVTFHNYLRAFYHFHPSSTVSSSTDESSITVPINQGDVILVHSVHPNGWADGTLLVSGARGWLPTNYCEAYDHEAIRSLLNALTTLWDVVRCSGESADMTILARQDYVRGMIAGVRFFLDQTRCLSREAPLIQTHVGLRRMRKGLLGDLSSLVKISKSLQAPLREVEALNPSICEILDELVLKAFKVVTRAVRFLDIWDQDVNSTSISYDLASNQRPLTPPTDSIESVASHEVDGSANDVPSSAVLPEQTEAVDDRLEASPRSQALAALTAQTSPVSPQKPQHARSRPLSIAAKRVSVTHRLSYTNKGSSARRQNLASEKLSTAHDAFLGHIGSFIGSHLQSRSSSELLEITAQSVEACKQLLAVVAEVWERDSRRTESLAEAKDTMYAKLGELVQATKDVLMPSDTTPGEEVFVPSEGVHLVVAATSCVRAAGDCVTKTRQVIEKIGDFEIEQVGLGISQATIPERGSTSSSEEPVAAALEPESSATDSKPLPPPPPPEPTCRPPPPPIVVPESKPLPGLPDPSPVASPETPEQLLMDEDQLPEPTPSAKPILPQLNISSDFKAATFTLEDNRSPDSTSSTFFKANNNDASTVAHSTTNSIDRGSFKGDAASVISHASTRPTTPDRSPANYETDSTFLSSFGSVSELQSMASEDCRELEEQMLEKTYAHELIYNKEGQITGGSLPALVEKLTTHDSTPDAMFVTTFYLTFRLFTSPVELAQCLIDRFDYIGESKDVGTPVRLRVYNAFKGWLESHWQNEPDSAALGIILAFATGKLRAALPNAGKRLAELTARVTEVHAGSLVPRLVSSLGKTSTSVTVFSAADTHIPNPTVTRSQLSALRSFRNGGPACSILDFDPLELARQFTIIESRIFCAIQPEELLGSEWTKKNSRATNVRAMSTLSTDLANLVADTILSLEEPKKRALIIKQWVKIALKCLELNNYDSLMAIICSLNSSMVLRLKRTWELISQKTLNRFNELKSIVDVAKNYAVLRTRLQNHVAPCIPFVGIYLTDLTFVDVGNQSTRQLPGDGSSAGADVINFDKHMKTARIIGQLQRFQVPYRLAAVPEMQDWMEAQIKRVRGSEGGGDVQGYYRRSLLLEPREPPQYSRQSPPEITPTSAVSRDSGKEKFDLWGMFSTTNTSKEKLNG